MGAALCCMRQQPSAEHEQLEDDQLIRNSCQYVSPEISATEPHVNSAKTKEGSHLDTPENKYTMIGCMTLEDCLLASPMLNAHNHIEGEIQIFKHLPKTVSPTSPESNQDFFTPRMSFSADRLGILDETSDDLSANSMSRSASRKLGKRVRFRLPEETDIYLYYTPKDTLEE